MNKKIYALSLILLLSSNVHGMRTSDIKAIKKQIETFLNTDPTTWRAKKVGEVENLISALEEKKLEKTATQDYRRRLALLKKSAGKLKEAAESEALTGAALAGEREARAGAEAELAKTKTDLQTALREWSAWAQIARRNDAAAKDLAQKLADLDAQKQAREAALRTDISKLQTASEAEKTNLLAALSKKNEEYQRLYSDAVALRDKLVADNKALYNDRLAQIN